MTSSRVSHFGACFVILHIRVRFIGLQFILAQRIPGLSNLSVISMFDGNSSYRGFMRIRYVGVFTGIRYIGV